jgi:putative ABC transport system permease protein
MLIADKKPLVMYKNYFKAAIRNLLHNKTYGFLNIAGLAVGIACAALIFLWVEDELTYNHHHKDLDRIYRVWEHQTYDGKTFTFGATPGVLARGMQDELPGVEITARTDWGMPKLFVKDDKNIFEHGMYMDSSFFRIFDFPFIKGDPSKPFNQLHSIVISKTMAEKFFKNANDAYGKTLKMDNEQEYFINGIFEDLPANSSFKFNWAVPFKLYEDNNQWLTSWGSNGVQTYVKVAPNTDVKRLNEKLLNFIQSKDENAVAKAFLFPITDWRLYSKFEDGKQVGGRIEYVRLFSIIAWIILIIACINFMNLATARSEKRAREVGVRKVLGAGKGKLVFQFLTESVILSFIAVILSVIIVYISLGGFNKLVEKELVVRISDPLHLGSLLVIGLVCGLIAGSYPALYLSSFKPIVVLKGIKIKGSTSAGLIRKGLVVTQFAISIILIISTIIIYQQVQHVKNRQLGYDKEQLVYMDLQGKMNEKFRAIYQNLLSTGVVENAAVSNQRVLQMGNNGWSYSWQGKDPESKILITNEWVSSQYIKTLGMNLKMGRDFGPIEKNDSLNIIVNESFAKLMNKEDVVGEIVRNNERDYQIIGVVEDFVYTDMYAPAMPLILFAQPSSTNYLFVRLKDNVNIKNALAKVESVVKTHNPGYPFEYKFMDEEFHKLFKSEMLIGTLSRVFAFLAIFISCLGLFGLAAYTAERRTKEIGIRKVLGASIASITKVLSADFLKLVFVSFLIAFPIAWYLMNKWLEDYAYRITINWIVFVYAGIAAIVIAVITISYQTIKAALTNPVKNLRME